MKQRRCLIFSAFVALFLTLATIFASGCGALHWSTVEPSSAPNAVPVEPVSGILDAFRSYNVVAISEGTNHGDEQGHAFLLSLVSDRRAAGVFNDIVVEWGNAFYQEVIDRFIDGEDVPEGTLRKAWENTTQPHHVWDSPLYENFFRAVRSVNQTLPKADRFRVLLGDPPLNWDDVHTKQDPNWRNAMSQRDSHPADLIRREVLAKNRKALVVYGRMHLLRRNMYPSESASTVTRESIVQRLEQDPSAKVFSVSWATDLQRLQPDVASWAVPTMALIQKTRLGEADFTNDLPNKGFGWRTAPPSRMEDQFDAVLHAGPASSIKISGVSRSRCADHEFMEMRINRMKLLEVPGDVISKLQRHCRNQIKS